MFAEMIRRLLLLGLVSVPSLFPFLGHFRTSFVVKDFITIIFPAPQEVASLVFRPLKGFALAALC